MAAFVAFALVFVFAGTSIIISGAKGDYSYTLYESDRNRAYEDSYLFNNILGNNLADVIRLIAIRSQLETAGEYDSEKTIDVTAYVNRGTTLPGDYVTAVYTVADLLKWAQSGFTYETRNFTEEESRSFLSERTTYTHLKNNLMSGGMNSYLSSGLSDNSVAFTVSGNSIPSGGTHNILVSRYQTTDGRNIEDLVSNWEEYSLLCSNVEEAAKTLLYNFEEYGKLLSYYGYQSSNLRYYISRTINGSTSVYTNISELSGETTGIDIKSVFEAYGRYIYYCPYELKYETNTLIKENVVRSFLKTYSYAYPDQIKVYVAVDTIGYPCSDDFYQGKSSFTKYMPYRTQILILCFVAAFIYILLFIITLKSPLVVSGSSIKTEIACLKNIIIMAVPLGAFVMASVLTQMSYMKMIRLENFPVYAALGAFVFNVGFLGLIYGIADKVKEKSLWKDSILRMLIIGAKNLILTTTDNGNVIIRTWIPYIFFVVINLCLFKIGLAGIVIAAFLDILIGIYLYRQNLDRDSIIKVIERIKNGDVKSKVDVSSLHSDNIALAEAVNSIGEGIEKAVDTSMKDEKLKADLITNVSHDIKTPLTSIINYVDLIKREDIGNERVIEYVNILDQKSQKLKKLTEDLVEASKISSGNISIELSKIDFVELINQTIGEFFEKFEKSGLTPIFKANEKNISIVADARHLWRVLENLFNNTCKYAFPGTRVYLEMYTAEDKEGKKKAFFSIKNISAKELNVSAEELTKKFIRGDESRTTEGSGLGLSIAKNLTIAQGGTFDIRLDGDLFKVIIGFDIAE
ncbi:sensor histidine kinase [Butyrivibrio proteoclasticus]|uniref:sensor histidine kinase n=1 Tax=Butyrivibrio proteoclasticus TaxID=43305 RepID=UPI001A9A6BC8|nr:HAMP domain-containing sensor histidine kinase [Butyrivibrio proteoclasticus]